MPQSSKHSAFLLNVDVTHNSTVNQININQNKERLLKIMTINKSMKQSMNVNKSMNLYPSYVAFPQLSYLPWQCIWLPEWHHCQFVWPPFLVALIHYFFHHFFWSRWCCLSWLCPLLSFVFSLYFRYHFLYLLILVIFHSSQYLRLLYPSPCW